MNTELYTRLLANPQDISPEHLSELDKVVEKYPFFQSARALQLKAYKNEGSYLYNDALKVTAAHTTDRDVLFQYITSESFTQNEISRIIKQHSPAVMELEVISDNVSESVSAELNREIKKELRKAEAILDPELFERKLESVEQIIPEESIEAESVLKLDTPLDFRKDDTHSFNEWLKLTKATPIERDTDKTDKKEDATKADKFQLIDKFIQENPKISPAVTSGKKKNLAKRFTQVPETLMTETLAKVYVQQNQYDKAIKAYDILILKYPEKSGFFADQIRAIKELINKEGS